MPFALYSRDTGQIFNVLYALPVNDKQLAAITAQGMAFTEVSVGVSPANAMIDLNTGQPLQTSAKMTYYYKYEFNASTGVIHHTGSSNIPDGDPQLTQANMILSTAPLPLQNEMILTLDADGKPTKDDAGNYVAVVPPPVAQQPNVFTLLITAAVNSGNLDPAIIPDQLLTTINASLQLAGGQVISKPAA